MTVLRSVFGMVPVLALAALAGLIVAAVRWIFGREPFDITHDDDQPDEDLVIDEPLTAPGLNHPAHRPLPKRKTWADEQGDQFAAPPAIPVAEIVTFTDPQRIKLDKAICTQLEQDFTADERGTAIGLNASLSRIPYRSQQ